MRFADISRVRQFQFISVLTLRKFLRYVIQKKIAHRKKQKILRGDSLEFAKANLLRVPDVPNAHYLEIIHQKHPFL
jgi:hypothetical protein